MNFWHWLVLLLIGLKLTHFIDWSWWLILLPFWIGWALIFAISFLAAFLKRR